MAMAAPAGVRAVPSLVRAISVNWLAAEGASGYVIEAAPTAGGPFTEIATVSAPLTTFRHAGLAYEQQVYYRVKTIGSSQASFSQVVTATTHPQGHQVRILALGDSNTEGSSVTTNNVAVPVSRRAGYRSELYRLLSLTELHFDFVGHLQSGGELVPDQDHAGMSGIRDQDVASLLQHGYYPDYFNNNEQKIITQGPYLDTYQPDVILLQVGMNYLDGSPGGMNDLKNILDQVDAYEARANKEVTVLLSTLLMRVCYEENGTSFCPSQSDFEATNNYNTYMKQMAAERVATGDRLILLDMEEANIDYRYRSPSGGEMADPKHPIQSGYDKMAQVWYKALQQDLRLEYKAAVLQVLPSLAGSLTLKWTGGSPDVENYIIETATSATGSFMSLASVPGTSTSYRHTGLAPSQTMYYRIRSFDGETYTAYSQVVSGTTRAANHVYKVMPLGDSNTEGSKVTTDNRPVPVEQRAGYRSELARMLGLADIRFDFVGSNKSGSSLLTDEDHAGFPGLRDQDIASILRNGYYFDNSNTKVTVTNGPYLDVYKPDIILLHIGTNSVDGSPAGMNDMTEILNQVDAYEARSGKEVTVVLSKIIRRVCYTEAGTTHCPDRAAHEATISFNNNLGTMAASRMAAGDRLVLVDMADANIDYRYASISGGDMADPLHPTQAGYNKMSGVWFNALSTELVFSTLPVEMVSFSAAVTEGGVVLHWRTASEKNNSHYEVQRMPHGGQFETIATVAGAGTSSISQNYTYADQNAPGGTLYYRLMQVDLNSTFSHSKVVAVENTTQEHQADLIYPNPGNGGSVSLQVHGFAHQEQVNLLLTDSIGRQTSLAAQTADGNGSVAAKLDFAQSLRPGLYIIKIYGSSKTTSLKFLVR